MSFKTSGSDIWLFDAPERYGEYEMGKPHDLNDLMVAKTSS